MAALRMASMERPATSSVLTVLEPLAAITGKKQVERFTENLAAGSRATETLATPSITVTTTNAISTKVLDAVETKTGLAASATKTKLVCLSEDVYVGRRLAVIGFAIS